MSKKPLISIIIPIYNGEKFIDKCYNCISKQDYNNLEIIFVNDGSKDSTLLKLKEIAEKDNRVVVLNKENGGPASARNAGIENAKGMYSAFIDVDDEIDTDYIDSLLNGIGEGDICICKYQRDNSQIKLHFPTKSIMGGGDAVKYIFDRQMHTVMITPWCKLIKTSYLKNYFFKVGRKCEDEEWSYRFLYNAQKITFIDRALYNYKEVAGSDSHTISFERLYDSALNDYEKMVFFREKRVKRYYYFAAKGFYENILALLYMYKNDRGYFEKLKRLYDNNKIPFVLFVRNNLFFTIKIMLKVIRYKLK